MCDSDIASRLVIISGPSGAGKDTIVSRLLELDDRFTLSVSATTRPMRKGERDGVNYYFISEDEFLKKAENGDFIEYARYGSRYYGTLKSDVCRRIDEGKIVILVIEVTGANNIKKMYPHVFSLFIMPPSEEILERRLRLRQTDSESDISSRLNIAKDEIKCRDSYDCTVVNDELDRAVDRVYSLINQHIK